MFLGRWREEGGEIVIEILIEIQRFRDACDVM